MCRQVAVRMPWNTLRSDLRMFAQKFQSVGTGGGIVLLIRKGARLARGLLLHAQPPVYDGENIMRRQVIWIYGLKRLILASRLVVLMLLIERSEEHTSELQ